jgi:hypothetical protein
MTLLDFVQTFRIHFLYQRRHIKIRFCLYRTTFNSFSWLYNFWLSDSEWINFRENFSEASCSFSGTGEKAYVCTLNPFLFIRGLSCPSCIQATISLNCAKLTIPGFPYNCLPVSCGDIGFFLILGLILAWKSGLKGTVQWELRWFKIGSNRSIMMSLSCRPVSFTLPQGTPSREEHKRSQLHYYFLTPSRPVGSVKTTA